MSAVKEHEPIQASMNTQKRVISSANIFNSFICTSIDVAAWIIKSTLKALEKLKNTKTKKGLEMKKNPYANADGSPKPGQLLQFNDFERKLRREKMQRMSEREQEQYREGLERFFERMQS